MKKDEGKTNQPPQLTRASTRQTSAASRPGMKDEEETNQPPQSTRASTRQISAASRPGMKDEEETNQPPQLTRASTRQASASRPGAFAVNSSNGPGRSRSDDFSLSEFTEQTDQQVTLGGETSTNRAVAPTTNHRTPSSLSELTAESLPIIAILVEDHGPPATIYEHDGVPEAIRTTVWSDRRVRLVIGALVVMVLVAVGAVVGLLVFGGGDEDDPNRLVGPKPPTAAPSVSPTVVGQDILDILVDASFDGGAALRNVSSPQYLASEWLLDNPNTVTYSRTRLLQRYALSTLYYSAVVDNDESVFTSQPLLNDECLDFGFVKCDNSGNVVAVESTWTGTRGTLPDELGLLSDLKLLDLGGNTFRGTLPSTLGVLTELESLGLRWNQFSGSIPAQFAQLANLNGLGLEYNMLTGHIPTFLGQLSALQRLGLHENRFVGSIPTELWSMTELQKMYFSSNQLTGTIATAVGQLQNMREISFSGNQFVGTLPTQIANLYSLVKLDVAGNELTGSLPVELFLQRPDLRSLNLAHNKFSGAIPTQLSLLTALSESLLLNDNQLTSTIPTELGRLRRLGMELDLSNNRLNGTIPTELGWLSNLEHSLSLASNQLSGIIPSELGSLSRVSSLRFESNSAIGSSLPSELGLLQSLATLSVYDTGLSGPVPVEVCNLQDVQLATFEVDCDLACTCCSNFCF